MIKDAYVRILVDEQEKLNIDTNVLCRGICDEDMYRKMISGGRALSRVLVKRLLARLGVDNANYEHYLDKPDYDMWLRRMQIINAVEADEIEEAEILVEAYMEYIGEDDKEKRRKLEKQFQLFMKLQMAKHGQVKCCEDDRVLMYKTALELTVPDVDKISFDKLLVSPLECALLVDYASCSNKSKSIDAIMSIYRELLAYIDDAPYGKLAVIKIYPKTVISLYKDIQDKIIDLDKDEAYEIYEELLAYCEKAYKQLKERSFLYYMTEILEMRVELCTWLKEHSKSISRIKEYAMKVEETIPLVETLVNEYRSHDVNPYMVDDCYLYRESGMLYIGEVIHKRRNMLGMSRKEFCEGIISERTLENTEKNGNSLQQYNFQNVFLKLGLYPDYMDVSIVTDKKEAVEVYEELKYAENSFQYDDVRKCLTRLKILLDDNMINKQYIKKVETINNWKCGYISSEECIEGLKEALEYTVSLSKLTNAGENLMVTCTEAELLYSLSVVMKKIKGSEEEMWTYINVLWFYCKCLKKDKMLDSRSGLYELVMTHIASLLGDKGEYDESNQISEELLKMLLKLRYSHLISSEIYNITWNNDQRGYSKEYYKNNIKKAICFCRLTNNYSELDFYENKLFNV